MKILKKTGNDGILQVKENQRNLLKECERACCEQKPISSYGTNIQAHGRRERRTTTVYGSASFAPIQQKLWPTIASVIRCHRERGFFDTISKQWVSSKEDSFYVSTRVFSAREAQGYIRRHWHIENKNHYVRDVSMHEDASRIRVNADRMVRLRSFALNILRVQGEKNIKRALFENALSLQRVLDYHGVV